MATLVGSLVTNLTLESSSFVASLKRAADETSKQTKLMERGFSLAKSAVAGFLSAFSVGALASAIKGALDYSDAIADLADRTGASTKLIQEFRFAAQQSGSSLESADAALERFAKTMGDAQRGAKEQSALLKELGVTSANYDVALRQTIEGISKLDSIQQRNAATLKVFGRSASDLTALISGGAKGFDQLASAADRLGIVLDSKLIRNAGEVNDKLDAMRSILTAQFASTVVENADALLQLANGLSNVVRFAGTAADKIREIGRANRERVLEGIVNSSGIFAPSEEEKRTAAKALADLRAERTREQEAGLRALGRALTPSLFTDRLVEGARQTENVVKNITAATKSTRAETDKFADSSQRLAEFWMRQREEMQRSLATVGPLIALPDAPRFDATTIDYDGIGRMAGRLNDELERMNVNIRKSEQFAEGLGLSLAYGLEDAIIHFRDLGDVATGVLQDIAREFLRMQVTAPLLKWVGGLDFSGLFGGARASGGPVYPGRAYLVGERGPELLVPRFAGNVIANGQFGGAVINQAISLHFDVGLESVDARIRQAAPAITAASARGVAQALANPGIASA